MNREDFEMGRKLIGEIEQYKQVLNNVNNKDLYMRIALVTSGGHEQIRLNSPNIIGEEEQERLNKMVRDSMRHFLGSRINGLEKELEEL